MKSKIGVGQANQGSSGSRIAPFPSFAPLQADPAAPRVTKDQTKKVPFNPLAQQQQQHVRLQDAAPTSSCHRQMAPSAESLLFGAHSGPVSVLESIPPSIPTTVPKPSVAGPR